MNDERELDEDDAAWESEARLDIHRERQRALAELNENTRKHR